MEENKPATETNVPKIASEDSANDAEARIAALELQKENYRKAYLKEVARSKDPNSRETEEERIDRIVRQNLAEANIGRIDTEKETLLKDLARENKELKLAQLNKKDIPASMTSSTESIAVRDTSITPEQLAHFKLMKWTDKDIEKYKKNLQKSGGR